MKVIKLATEFDEKLLAQLLVEGEPFVVFFMHHKDDSRRYSLEAVSDGWFVFRRPGSVAAVQRDGTWYAPIPISSMSLAVLETYHGIRIKRLEPAEFEALAGGPATYAAFRFVGGAE